MKRERLAFIVLTLIALVISASCLAKQAAGNGWDFFAYFKASGRVLNGESPYVYEIDFSYKYAPVVAYLFTPFHLWSYDVARWVYAFIHLAVALSLPLIVARLFFTGSLKQLIVRKDFLMGLLCSFVASLRFLDAEFQVSQVGLLYYLFIVLGFFWLSKKGSRISQRFLALCTLSLGVLFKMHSGLLFLSFLSLKKIQHLTLIAAAFLLMALIPNPSLWLDWAEHMARSTRDLPIQADSYNLQGFYPLAVNFLGLDQFSIVPMLLAVPLAILLFILFPGRPLSAIWEGQQKQIFLLVNLWLLLGLMASPLPWQYTYSILWPMIAAFYWVANSRERKWLWGAALLLGASPKGIVGPALSNFWEARQLVFATFLLLFFVFLKVLRTKRCD